MIECTCRECGVRFLYEQPKPNSRRLLCDECKREIHNARCREWAKKNPERRKRIRNAWTARNPEAMQACRDDWASRNKPALRRAANARKKRNPIMNRARNAARKAQMRNNQVVPFTAVQLAARMAYYDNRCWMCGIEAASIDHVKPISKGGAHMLANLRPACIPCNSIKNDRWPL